MRIEKTGNRPEEGHRAGGAKGAGGPIPGSHAKSFDSFLNDSQYKSMNEELILMAEDIKKQGQRLANRTNLGELLRYKKMVAQFLDISVRKMLEFRRKDYLDGSGKHHIYALVQKVDQNLEVLTREILDSQRDQLVVLNCIDDIRGLLMDLIL
ncbi:MAG TPA: YaaR family protein [Clostridia bacterium]|nr:YaaR family protein [Clostridia bacterium]